MANSDLYGKVIGKVPNPILEYIEKYLNKGGMEGIEGYEHAKNLLENPKITYSMAKKMKHFFDKYSSLNDSRDSFELCGGIKMKHYIDRLLDLARDGVIRGKEIRTIAFDNQYLKSHDKTFDKAPNTDNITRLSGTKNKNYISESEDKIHKTSICFVFNDNKILLVQRAKNDSWMPMKWAVVGGGINEGETPEDALKREGIEEVNLELTNIEFKYEKKEGDVLVYVFKSYCKNPDEIKLSGEHEQYKWVKINEVKNFNIVPNLIDDLDRVLK